MKTAIISTSDGVSYRVHELKSWPLFMDLFQHSGVRFDVRVNDRNFQKEDFLLFREYDSSAHSPKYGTRALLFKVTYTLSGWGVSPGHIALGLTRVPYANAQYLVKAYCDTVYPCSVIGASITLQDVHTRRADAT